MPDHPVEIVTDCEQGTPEWHAMRAGCLTASRAKRIITPKEAKPSKQVGGLIRELIGERIQGTPEGVEQMVTRPMQNGIDTEPEARRWYAMHRKVDVQQVAFVRWTDQPVGCSPDGLVGEDGILELKCPELTTHIGYTLPASMDPSSLIDDYKVQCHFALLVTGRKWVDLVSYCLGLPPIVERITPDDFTESLRQATDAFLAKYADAWGHIAALATPPDPPEELTDEELAELEADIQASF